MSIARIRLSASLAAIAAIALLGGCASTGTVTEEIDYAKIAQVERAARYFGTQVIWVNYPTKRVEATRQ